MKLHRIRKVQSPAVNLRLGGRRIRFGAHNFIAVLDEDLKVAREMHGIARGPGGAQLPILGGVLPFRREVLWGETYGWRTGFYDESHPQVDLLVAAPEAIAHRLRAADAVQTKVNARNVRYPWPAIFGANSNAYFATLLAAMGLPDKAAPGALWAPSARRTLLPAAEIAAIRAAVP